MAVTQNKLFSWISIAVLLLCAWLLFSSIFGYGHIVVHAPSDATVEINGHKVAANKSIRIRPGKYSLTILSPKNLSLYDSVDISLLGTKNYTPKLTQRSITSIAQATNGVSSGAGLPLTAFDAQWFGDDWVVMEFGESTPSVLVAHYADGRWNREYTSASGDDISKLPPDVASKVSSLEEFIRANF